MATESVFIIGALAVACVGGIADILTSKIPNRLTYGGMIVAIGAHLVIGGWSGLGASIAGGLIGGGAFFVFFLLHAEQGPWHWRYSNFGNAFPVEVSQAIEY